MALHSRCQPLTRAGSSSSSVGRRRVRPAACVRCRAMAAPGSGLADMPAVVTPAWLQQHLGDVRVLDCSWYLPPMGRDAVAEFSASRIPGASFWDVDGVADASTDLPHMLPSEAAFGAAADALGVGPDTPLVLYDGLGLFASPRAWWTWRVFGHERVAVLEGGLPAWQAAGLPIDTSPASEEARNAAAAAARAAQQPGAAASPRYTARLQRDKVASMADVQRLVAPAAAAAAAGAPLPRVGLVDARPAGRFRGDDPEPRPGLPSGHVPGAASVPFSSVYVGGSLSGAALRPTAELEALFADAGVDVRGPLVCSCGSGLTACVLALAVHAVTQQLPAVYDGSWCEWAAAPGAPIVKGEA